MNYFNPKYEAIGNAIIKNLFPELMNARIAWLSSDRRKMNSGKLVFAECRKISEQYDWCCDYDFSITVFEPNVVDLDEDQMNILLEHELMHANFKDGNASINPHDTDEFIEIIRKYGIDWSVPKCK